MLINKQSSINLPHEIEYYIHAFDIKIWLDGRGSVRIVRSTGHDVVQVTRNLRINRTVLVNMLNSEITTITKDINKNQNKLLRGTNMKNITTNLTPAANQFDIISDINNYDFDTVYPAIEGWTDTIAPPIVISHIARYDRYNFDKWYQGFEGSEDKVITGSTSPKRKQLNMDVGLILYHTVAAHMTALGLIRYQMIRETDLILSHVHTNNENLIKVATDISNIGNFPDLERVILDESFSTNMTTSMVGLMHTILAAGGIGVSTWNYLVNQCLPLVKPGSYIYYMLLAVIAAHDPQKFSDPEAAADILGEDYVKFMGTYTYKPAAGSLAGKTVVGYLPE